MGRLVTQPMVTAAAAFRLCRSFRDTMSFSHWKPPTNPLAAPNTQETRDSGEFPRFQGPLTPGPGRWEVVTCDEEKRKERSIIGIPVSYKKKEKNSSKKATAGTAVSSRVEDVQVLGDDPSYLPTA